MSDAIITVILTQVATILEQQIRREVGLICGVEKNLKKLESEFNSIKAVLVDAEKRQVKEEAVKLWLEKLKQVSYDTEDVLSEWITAIQKAEIEGQSSHSRKVFPLSCFGFNRVFARREISLKIKKINERLVDIAIEKDRYKFNESCGSDCFVRPKSASHIDESQVEGRHLDKNNLINRLLGFEDRNQERGMNVVSIVGLGGIGKTTLAQFVYNSSEVREHFVRRIWVCVSDLSDEVRIAKAILEDIEEGSAPYLFELETVVRKIRNYVKGEKFLLVLDDVWTRDFRKWEHLFNSLRSGASGSTILVTTRDESVANVMGSSYQLRLGGLSDNDSWTLFEKIAFFERKSDQRLEDLGKMIARKCQGLPLAIKTIASLMRFKNTLDEWKDVLDSDFWTLEEAEGLFPPLMLSYYNLPSPIKRCFSFCAFFPKDHVIEASNLIQLWMAHGYLISSENNVDIEITGQEYLQNLAMRSFFQDIVKDKNSGIILSFKMHDVIHDFANYLTKNECSVIEFNPSFQPSHNRARHLTLVRAEDTPFPNIPNVEKLHTFWVQSFHDCPHIITQIDRVDPDLICRLASLRALDLSRNRIGELPKDIGNLIKLKYLNLSHNPFLELPETLCELFSLVTLKLSSCDHLRRLPSRVSKLVNLRHLEIDRTDSLKTLPKGISSLKKLRILTKFAIIRVNNRGDDSSCGLEDLKNLNNLRGCLKIEGLGYVVDANEARKAELRKKIHLSDLEMDFSPSIQSGTNQDKVIEALEVHENLQSLQISSFGGNKLPDWIMKLTNLKKLILQDCQNCTVLPFLGGLPSLDTLHLEGMKGITSLGLDFLGGRLKKDEEESPAFPNLKKLKISNMERWEEWSLKDENVDIMPRLRCLKISRCSKVKALPIVLLQRLPIRKLRIDDCPLLQQHYNKETGKHLSKISHIPKIRVS